MHYLNYLLVFALVAIVIALIFDARKSAPPTPHIKRCPACGSPANLTGCFIESQVKCSNIECATMGPIGHSESEAVAHWNKLSTV